MSHRIHLVKQNNFAIIKLLYQSISAIDPKYCCFRIPICPIIRWRPIGGPTLQLASTCQLHSDLHRFIISSSPL